MNEKRYALVFDAMRTGYGIDQIANSAMTVGELKRLLEDYNDDTLVVLSHDNGYTYGTLTNPIEYAENDDGEFEQM